MNHSIQAPPRRRSATPVWVAIAGGVLVHSLPALANPSGKPRFAQLSPQPADTVHAPAAAAPAAPGAGNPNTPHGLEVPLKPDKSPQPVPAPPPAESTNPATTQAPTAPVATPDTGTPEVSPAATAAEGREISDVRVVGNRVVPSDTILAQVRTQRGAAFSNRQADLDRGRIAQLGYFASVQVQVSPDIDNPTKVITTFIVVENRVITDIKFVNSTLISADELKKVVRSSRGGLLNSNVVSTDVQALQKAYQDKGFAVLVQSASQDTDGSLIFTFQEARISSLRFSGLKHTHESLLRRQLRVKTGDAFDQVKLRKDLNRMYDLGFFEDVNFKVDDDPNTPGAVIVTFILKEKRTGSFSVGVGFDSRSKLSGFVTLSENNLHGSGKRALASVETGAERNYELSYGDPFVGKNNSSYDVSIYQRTIFREPTLVNQLAGGALQTSNNTYEEHREGGRLTYSKPLDYDRNRTVTFGYRNERAKLFQRDSSGVAIPLNFPEFSTGTVSAFSVGLVRDVRDIRLDPSKGNRQELVVEQAVKGLGGTDSFTKLDLDLRQYFPLQKPAKAGELPKTVLAGRLVASRALKQLPTFEQYYIGGSDTVRGYNSDQQFGDNQVFGNIELRYRLQKRFQLVGFVDGGHAFGGQFSSDTNPGEKRVLYSVGAGVRVQTPIGPIRLDVGRGSDGIKTHFGIGSTF